MKNQTIPHRIFHFITLKNGTSRLDLARGYVISITALFNTKRLEQYN